MPLVVFYKCVILHYMNFTTNTTMTHVPMCHTCGQAEVAGPFTTADGEGFCSAACQAEAQAEFAAWSAEQDAEYDESMDGDFDSGMASAGFGTDEDY